MVVEVEAMEDLGAAVEDLVAVVAVADEAVAVVVSEVGQVSNRTWAHQRRLCHLAFSRTQLRKISLSK